MRAIGNYFFAQVPSEDMTRYCTALTNELHAPLELALRQPEVDRTTIGTVLMCETILSLLPSMSTKDAPYQLLKDYCIAPLASGVIARKRRIALTEVAEVDPGTNTLVVPRGLTRAVFLPLENISREAKKEAIRMMKFLKQVRIRMSLPPNQTVITTSAGEKCEQEDSIGKSSWDHSRHAHWRNGGGKNNTLPQCPEKSRSIESPRDRRLLHYIGPTVRKASIWLSLYSSTQSAVFISEDSHQPNVKGGYDNSSQQRSVEKLHIRTKSCYASKSLQYKSYSLQCCKS